MGDGKISGPTASLVRHVEARDTLDAYADQIQDLLRDNLVGVYLYGSVVRGDHRQGISDVDVVVLHRSDLDDGQRWDLAGLHGRMGRHAGADRLDVSFVPLRLVGTYGEAALPYFRDGRFHEDGGGDLNMVTWRSLREHGLALCGVPPAEVVPPVSPKDLSENMRRNLAFLSRRMPTYVAAGAEETVFGVLSVCRVLYTLRTGDLTGKVAAARWALDSAESRWGPLTRQALRRYEDDDFSGTDVAFRARALAFAYRISETAGRRGGSPAGLNR